jgi:hypothetical protein
MTAGTISLTQRGQLDQLCDIAARMGLVQLPLLRAAADGLIAHLRIEDPGTRWPSSMVKRLASKPTCFSLGGDPGFEFPTFGPRQWMAAEKLRRWCHAAIVHGAGGETEHYRTAVAATLRFHRVALIETTSALAMDWARFLAPKHTLVIVPTDGVHPLPEHRGAVQ